MLKWVTVRSRIQGKKTVTSVCPP